MVTTRLVKRFSRHFHACAAPEFLSGNPLVSDSCFLTPCGKRDAKQFVCSQPMFPHHLARNGMLSTCHSRSMPAQCCWRYLYQQRGPFVPTVLCPRFLPSKSMALAWRFGSHRLCKQSNEVHNRHNLCFLKIRWIQGAQIAG
jgi:hypothetical protein